MGTGSGRGKGGTGIGFLQNGNEFDGGTVEVVQECVQYVRV